MPRKESWTDYAKKTLESELDRGLNLPAGGILDERI